MGVEELQNDEKGRGTLFDDVVSDTTLAPTRTLSHHADGDSAISSFYL